MSKTLTLQVNRTQRTLAVSKEASLLHVLRNDFELNSPKYGCGLGECGACTVLVDGVAARACAIPAQGVAGRSVTTLEGLGSLAALHPVQQAFIDEQAAQCGYCLSGMVMMAVALLARTPHPTEAEIRNELSGNLCRCGAHLEIIKAVQRAAHYLAQAQSPGPAPLSTP
jgi:nicotinate dehydrogenase subunit A